ncbi:hypothetical protein AYR66_16415 [Noviherbaspirillum denitrificans]|uniref:ResB-like domain-containing protein n=1 Tax=Noviherbaspirillum denitrificans TaxID=1968433 RepID=A0A254TDU2_9BURK|nr:hypothetical protein AYR66_16415 [Noviherbaspirillum denitrificans]
MPPLVYLLASRKLTVLFFLLTAGASLAIALEKMPATELMLAPFILLVANICAAIFASARFRADLPLLLFHLCLVALVALVGLARLTYMEGVATLSSGTAFEGVMLSEKSGLLHGDRFRALHFANDGFNEDYFRRGTYRATYNRVRWQDEQGAWQSGEIGDDRPLILQGYRIYTTRNRGFSPLFHWQPADGKEPRDGIYGTVQLNDMPVDTISPSVKWELPGGIQARAILDFETPDARKALHGTKDLPHTLTLKIRDTRHELRPGDKAVLPEGTLTYVQLDSWMGYQISYDPTQPWIMATVLLGIASLIRFYWRRIW